MPTPTTDDLYASLAASRARSRALYDEACAIIPGGTVSRARILPPFPFFAARGKGSRLYDVDGREYTDLLGGIATTILGHAHPKVVEAITAQAAKLGHVSNLAMHEPGLLLAERLLDLAGRPGRVFFCNSGAEANEAAFKISRLTGRIEVVTAVGSFHGRTMGALALTGQPGKADAFAPGDKVKIAGTSKGKGFQGTVKRHGFSRGPVSHGSHNVRAPGSIGAAAYPARVFKGIRGPGQMGNKRVTQKGLEVVQVDAANNLLLVRGSVPGPRNGVVEVRSDG